MIATDSVRAFCEAMDDLPRCPYCSEPVRPGEWAQAVCVVLLGAGMPRHELATLHRECMIRQVVGSVGHQLGTCGCFGGTEDDPAGMTRREAARAAMDLYRERKGV